MESSEANISIIDISGKELINLFKNTNEKLKKVNVINLNSGMYIVKVHIGSRILYEKLVIVKQNSITINQRQKNRAIN